ncbi:unnamed protein product, partial [Lampetra planeri]
MLAGENLLGRAPRHEGAAPEAGGAGGRWRPPPLPPPSWSCTSPARTPLATSYLSTLYQCPTLLQTNSDLIGHP